MSNLWPFKQAAAVTLHDSTEVKASAFFVGGAGNLKVTTINGDVVTLNGCLAGHVYPIAVKVFWTTGSTATNVVALF